MDLVGINRRPWLPSWLGPRQTNWLAVDAVRSEVVSTEIPVIRENYRELGAYPP